MKINRRHFLIGAAATSVAASTLTEDNGISLYSASHPIKLHDSRDHDLSKGFGLAPLKAEGQTVRYDITEGITRELVEDHHLELSKDTVWDHETDVAYGLHADHHIDGS